VIVLDFKERTSALLSKQSYGVDDLEEIVSLLRSENGCPWDKVQTHESIRRDFLEETYEVLEAIDLSSPEMLREELGDVLLQVVFHADIEKDKGTFSLDDVADEVCKKLILRHPHVFGDVQADSVDKVLSNWDAIKKEEKNQESFADTLKSVPKTFPSLMRAQKLGKRASRAGIDFADADDVMSTLKSMVNGGASLSDILFVCANAARFTRDDSEEELSFACDRFTERFEQIEKSGRLQEATADELYNTSIEQI
jgi:tetrapyrrole methylase family protein/MazG family protein